MWSSRVGSLHGQLASRLLAASIVLTVGMPVYVCMYVFFAPSTLFLAVVICRPWHVSSQQKQRCRQPSRSAIGHKITVRCTPVRGSGAVQVNFVYQNTPAQVLCGLLASLLLLFFFSFSFAERPHITDDHGFRFAFHFRYHRVEF